MARYVHPRFQRQSNLRVASYDDAKVARGRGIAAGRECRDRAVQSGIELTGDKSW